ncbi:MAG: hypothetical protein EDM05_012975 [Leptolyngbya sp. IPPAS B-1204]
MDLALQPAVAVQPPELGLVCITVSDRVRFRAMTRKRLLQLALPEQEQALRTLYAENLKRLSGAVSFCQGEAIRLYRLSSAVFPFPMNRWARQCWPNWQPTCGRLESGPWQQEFAWCCIRISL